VVSVRGATQRIRDGDWITIDGTTGAVELDSPS
jgi:phosphohistidine swiveling domain-containing protein